MKRCYFCTNNIKKIDYKDTKNLSQFIDEQAKILRKKETSLCAKHQRKMSKNIKRARFLALLPFVRH